MYVKLKLPKNTHLKKDTMSPIFRLIRLIYIYMIDSDKQTKLFNQNGIMYCMLVKIQRNWFWFKGLFFGLIIAQIFNNIVYICRRFLKMHNDFDHISSLIIGESNLIFCFVLLFYIKKLRVSQQYFYLIFVFI